MKIVQLASLLLLSLMYLICFAGCARTGRCLGGGCGGNCGPQGCGVPTNPQANPQFFPQANPQFFPQTNPQFVPQASVGSVPQTNPGFIPSAGGSDVFGGNVSSPAGSSFGLGGSSTR